MSQNVPVGGEVGGVVGRVAVAGADVDSVALVELALAGKVAAPARMCLSAWRPIIAMITAIGKTINAIAAIAVLRRLPSQCGQADRLSSGYESLSFVMGGTGRT